MSGRLSELGKRTAAIIDLDRRMAVDAEIRIANQAYLITKHELSPVPFDTAKERMLQSRKLLKENEVVELETVTE